jgi:ribosomal protein L31
MSSGICRAVSRPYRAWIALGISTFALALETPAQETETTRYKPRPLPAGPESKTWDDFNATRRAWYEKLLLDAYREHGQRDPRWDADMEKLIRNHVRYWFEHARLDVDVKQQISAAADTLVKQGCEDPLLLHFASYYAFQCVRTQEARASAERAVERFASSGYPPMLHAWAIDNLIDIFKYRKESARGKKHEQPLLEARVAAAAHPMYTQGNQRFYAQEIGELWGFGKRAPEDAAEFVRRLEEQKGSDPWIVALLRGWMHIRLGWQARTGGTADTVSDEGWEKFFDHMEDARLSLRRAHELHPEYPEAAAAMVYVRMAHEDEASLREWLDRAVAAQFDYWEAYTDALWAMMPRWGGTHQAMLRLGQEALETGRFDTSIPELYPYALRMISQDYDESSVQEIFKGPKVYERLRDYCNGYAAARPEVAKKMRSALVLFAWAAGRMSAAAAIYHELGEDFVDEPTSYIKVDLDLLKRDIEPHLQKLRQRDAEKPADKTKPPAKDAGGGKGR